MNTFYSEGLGIFGTELPVATLLFPKFTKPVLRKLAVSFVSNHLGKVQKYGLHFTAFKNRFQQ